MSTLSSCWSASARTLVSAHEMRKKWRKEPIRDAKLYMTMQNGSSFRVTWVAPQSGWILVTYFLRCFLISQAHGWDVEQSDLALSGTSKFVNDFWPRVHLRYDAIVCSWGSCISKCLVCSIMHAIGLSFWGRIRKLNLIAEDYLNRVGRKEKGSERNKGSWTLDSQSQSANQRPAGKPSEVSCWSYKSMKLA